MAIKVYKLPHGELKVNKGNTVKVIFDQKSGNPIFLKPGQSKFFGSTAGLAFETYFLNPDFWDVRLQANKIIETKGKVDVLLRADEIDRYGDHVMLTIFPAAIKYTYGEKSNVDLWIPEKFKDVWLGNDDIREIYHKDPGKKEYYDVSLDANALELKFKPQSNMDRCSEQLLGYSKLYLANKTPKYFVTEEEKEWAKKKVNGKKRPLIGIAKVAHGKCREYSHMAEVQQLVEGAGYSSFVLDSKNSAGKFSYTFRQMSALVNECDVVVTADSAILHVCGALRKRVVGVFGSTGGEVTTEDYERALIIQGKCDAAGVDSPCWWELPCIKGKTYQIKETLAHTSCLMNLKPERVIEAVEEQLSKPKKLLLCMLTYNLLDMTKRAVDSIRSFHDYDFFIVDNESDDGTQEWIKSKGIDHTVKRTSVAGAQNLGLQKFLEGNYDYFILLNNDIVLRYDTIDQLVECAEETGAYGIMSTELPNTQHWALDSAKPKNNRQEDIKNIPPGSYSCTLLSRKCIERIGFFNERYKPRYIEDNDYTLRMRIDGGKFLKLNSAIYWHYLGGVVKNNAEAKRTHDDNWKKNVGIFQEIYGFSPHDDQRLEKLGPEWRRNATAEEIDQFIKDGNKAVINVRRGMGGCGDILFSTVIARELKKLFGDNVDIRYSIPTEFHTLLTQNPNIDNIFSFTKRTSADFRIDLTDLEFRKELQEMQQYGEIRSARTEIYLNSFGLSGDLKPDYFVKESEKEWAEGKWERCTDRKRVVFSMRGSNKLKIWPRMKELRKKLEKDNVMIIDLDEGRIRMDEEEDKYHYTFRKAAALVSTCDLVISPDSGISNLAGALDIPVVTIFSNRNGANFSKMYNSMIPVQGDCPFQEGKNYCDFFMPCINSGGPHRSKEEIRIPECMKRLTVNIVYKKIKYKE